MLPLIVLRPEPGASRTAAAAIALGLNPRKIPLFAVSALPWSVPAAGAFDALLLTSANAVRHAGPGLAALAHLPCHAVGEATAAAARAAGLNPLAVGTGGAQPLVDACIAAGARSLLWLAGTERSALAAAAPARITAVAVYTTAPIADPPGWADAAAHPAVVLLHSARAAQQAAALAGDNRNHLIALAISAAVARAAGPGWAHCAVAAAPTDRDMLAMARQLCQMRG